MAKEDLTLPAEMGRLEIEPVKLNKVSEEFPFANQLPSHQRKNIFGRTLTKSVNCTCSKNYKNMPISKKKHKVLREPVLKLMQNYAKKDELQLDNSVSLNALVDNCNQLRISSGAKEKSLPAIDLANNNNKWWKEDVENRVLSRETEKNHAGPSCSQQALNPPCDVTIVELASYFETLVHIPKKMSSMAEMMYI